MNDNLVSQYVDEWDDVYKKGQLSFWVLLSIYDSKKYAAEIEEFMKQLSNDEFAVKEQSLYRALRRFKTMKLVDITEEKSPASGTKRKYYSLTPFGTAVLKEFTIRNILPLTSPTVTSLLNAVESEQITNDNC